MNIKNPLIMWHRLPSPYTKQLTTIMKWYLNITLCSTTHSPSIINSILKFTCIHTTHTTWPMYDVVSLCKSWLLHLKTIKKTQKKMHRNKSSPCTFDHLSGEKFCLIQFNSVWFYYTYTGIRERLCIVHYK